MLLLLLLPAQRSSQAASLQPCLRHLRAPDYI
jgi:hypothetical protein